VKPAEALHAAQRSLAEAGIEEADLEAEVLLRNVLHQQRHELYARLQEEISPAQHGEFQILIERRQAHEPTAYIVGHKEFYGLELETTPAALIPRPETELLVDEALRVARSISTQRPIIADVGCGCGAIAVALAHHLPDAVIYALDISGEALALAARNAARLGLSERIRFLQGDLLDPLPEPADIIVANLPYVKSDEWETLPPEIREHEPPAALVAGPTGTEVIERLLRQAPRYLRHRGVLLLEIGWDEGESVQETARECFPEARVTVKKDLAELDRLLVVESWGEGRIRMRRRSGPRS
jgi:release factor glutamine methyltransferase